MKLDQNYGNLTKIMEVWPKLEKFHQNYENFPKIMKITQNYKNYPKL